MKLKPLVLAAALATSGAAFAAPINSITTGDAMTFASVTSPVTAAGFAFNMPGAFTDTFTFDLDPLVGFSISLTNSFTASTGKINFFAADLNGFSLALTSDGSSQKLAGDWGPLAGGLYTLTVTGTSVGVGGATYGMSAAAVPVPEPETYALMLAGLGAVGFIARRRKPANAA